MLVRWVEQPEIINSASFLHSLPRLTSPSRTTSLNRSLSQKKVAFEGGESTELVDDQLSTSDAIPRRTGTGTGEPNFLRPSPSKENNLVSRGRTSPPRMTADKRSAMSGRTMYTMTWQGESSLSTSVAYEARSSKAATRTVSNKVESSGMCCVLGSWTAVKQAAINSQVLSNDLTNKEKNAKRKVRGFHLAILSPMISTEVILGLVIFFQWFLF